KVEVAGSSPVSRSIQVSIRRRAPTGARFVFAAIRLWSRDNIHHQRAVVAEVVVQDSCGGGGQAVAEIDVVNARHGELPRGGSSPAAAGGGPRVAGDGA